MVITEFELLTLAKEIAWKQVISNPVDIKKTNLACLAVYKYWDADLLINIQWFLTTDLKNLGIYISFLNAIIRLIQMNSYQSLQDLKLFI